MTHLLRVARGAVVQADADSLFNSLPGLLAAAGEGSNEEGSESNAVLLRRDLAAECLAAILGQNEAKRPLLGEQTAIAFFVAMHQAAVTAGQPNAWHCWVLPAIKRAVPVVSPVSESPGVESIGEEGKAAELRTAAHALGTVATLFHREDVARASGGAALGELLTALEHLARTEGAADLRDLAHTAGARVYRQLRAIRSAGNSGQEA